MTDDKIEAAAREVLVQKARQASHDYASRVQDEREAAVARSVEEKIRAELSVLWLREAQAFMDGFLAGHASRDAEIAKNAPTLEGSEAKRCAAGHFPVYMHQEMQCPACSARKRADELGAEVEPKDAEIASLRSRLEAAEARAAKWVNSTESPEEFEQLIRLGWKCAPSASHYAPNGAWMILVVPPVPLPETEP